MVLRAHLDQVHEVVVAVLQEVHAELPQEEPDVEGGSPLVVGVVRLPVPLGHAPHRLARVMGVVLELGNGEHTDWSVFVPPRFSPTKLIFCQY